MGYVHNCPAQRLRDLDRYVLEAAKIQYELQLSRSQMLIMNDYIKRVYADPTKDHYFPDPKLVKRKVDECCDRGGCVCFIF